MRYFIYLQYDGTAYHGWQTQPNAISVQETIEEKLSLLLQRELFIIGAGRTDAGVHASLMTAHFEVSGVVLCDNGKLRISNQDEDELAEDTEVKISMSEVTQTTEACLLLTQKMNNLLPPDIAIQKIVPVKPDAHARFSPISRTYRYYITTCKSPFNRQYCYRIYWPLDIEAMNEAASKLFNYIDFTSFSRLHTDVKTNNCKIMQAHWDEVKPGEYVFVIQADRFLRNMVRAVVGTLLLVGRHRLSISDFCQIIEKKNRCSAGDSAPAQALFLEDIEYPKELFFNS